MITNMPTPYHVLFNQLSAGLHTDIAPNHKGEITREQAKLLFDKLKNVTDLHFDATENGCQNRTALMQNLITAAGIKTTTLMADNNYNDATGIMTDWYMHFSPGIYIANTEAILVLDPTTQSQPVTLQQWAENLGITNLRDIYNTPDLVGTKTAEQDLEKLAAFATQERASASRNTASAAAVYVPSSL